MKSSAKNVKLTSVDDLFSTEESRADEQREKVVEIPLSEIHPFENHPFKVTDDDRMLDMAESIREHGVLVPGLVRPREDGGYEMIAGHRRHRASELAERDTMPVIIRDLDDDAATIMQVANVDWVNLRKQDSKASPSLAKINEGENVTVLVDECGPENGWVRVLYSLGEHHTLSQDELDTGRTTLTGYIWHSFLEPVE